MDKENLGPKIGAGRDRVVYDHPTNPDWIVKLPRNENSKHQNVNEIAVWNYLKDKEDRVWIAPIVDYCPDGNWIIMERVERSKGEFPKENLPKWMADHHSKNNWGKYEGRYVLCDYGFDQIAKKLGVKPNS